MFSCAKAKWPTQSNVSAGFLVDYVESEDGGGAATSNRVIPGTSYVRSTYSSSLRLYYIRSTYVYTGSYVNMHYRYQVLL